MSARAFESEANISGQSPNPPVVNASSEEANGSAGGDQSSLSHQADSSGLSEGAPGVSDLADERDGEDVADGSDNASAAFSGNKVLTNDYFMDLAKDIGSEWKALAVRLGFTKPETDGIIESFREIKYRTLEILQCWQQKNATKNDREKVEVLCNALSKCNRDDLSEKVKSDAGFGS